MYNNNTSQPVGTNRFNEPSVYIEDLTPTEKDQLIKLATDIKKTTAKHLSENYNVAAGCEETVEGIVVNVQIFYFGNPVSGLQIEVESVSKAMEDRDKKVEETSKALVSKTIGELIEADEGPTNRKGS
jgi:hypothetical protein